MIYRRDTKWRTKQPSSVCTRCGKWKTRKSICLWKWLSYYRWDVSSWLYRCVWSRECAYRRIRILTTRILSDQYRHRKRCQCTWDDSDGRTSIMKAYIIRYRCSTLRRYRYLLCTSRKSRRTPRLEGKCINRRIDTKCLAFYKCRKIIFLHFFLVAIWYMYTNFCLYDSIMPHSRLRRNRTLCIPYRSESWLFLWDSRLEWCASIAWDIWIFYP